MLSGLKSIDINQINKTQYLPDFLEIRYSTIKNANLGIFCKKKIEKGTFLGNYTGKILNPNDSINDPNNHSAYCFNATLDGTNVIIDALDMDHSNWTRFMNCSYNKLVENVLVLQCNNTEIYTNQNNEQISLNGVIVFFAARDIEIGEELMYDYGKEYRNKLQIADYK